jgi:hypothetical protein
MKGMNGVQMQVHPKFLDLCKDIKDERIKLKKERNGELSNKRLSLTIVKLFKTKPELYNLIVSADIDLNEI